MRRGPPEWPALGQRFDDKVVVLIDYHVGTYDLAPADDWQRGARITQGLPGWEQWKMEAQRIRGITEWPA